jgi:uncharacterized membrane protein YraQ (UPF0718 family)
MVGLLGGAAAWWLEGRGYLDGQSRLPAPTPNAAHDACCADVIVRTDAAAGGTRTLTVIQPTAPTVTKAAKLRQLVSALWKNARKLAVFFLAFASIGYLLIRIIPTGVITGLLGEGNPAWSVPLAAVLGIPVYINTDASLPLVASLVHGGMAPGAAIAFLITGAGTSVASISGMLVIARWRVVALVVATLFVTAVATGWLSALWLQG